MFVYTREAHPGEEVPHHDSFESKLAAARLLRDETGIRRRILVDDLAGSAHHGYGLMPNMTWVIDQGRVAYKACWTSAANVEAFVERFLGTGEGTGTGEGVGTGTGNDRPYGTSGVYKTEQLELRQLDRNSFMNRLLRNGPRAATEFREAQRLWSQRA